MLTMLKSTFGFCCSMLVVERRGLTTCQLAIRSLRDQLQRSTFPWHLILVGFPDFCLRTARSHPNYRQDSTIMWLLEFVFGGNPSVYQPQGYITNRLLGQDSPSSWPACPLASGPCLTHLTHRATSISCGCLSGQLLRARPTLGHRATRLTRGTPALRHQSPPSIPSPAIIARILSITVESFVVPSIQIRRLTRGFLW